MKTPCEQRGVFFYPSPRSQSTTAMIIAPEIKKNNISSQLTQNA
jgi:hypothetical protein